jgi:hypothetical protein
MSASHRYRSLIGQGRLRWFGWLALPSGDCVLCVLDGLVETALAAGGLAVRQNRRRPLLPPSGYAPPWELVSASDLWWRRVYAGSNSTPCFSMANMMTASLRASATRALRIVDRLAMSSAHVFSARLPR